MGKKFTMEGFLHPPPQTPSWPYKEGYTAPLSKNQKRAKRREALENQPEVRKCTCGAELPYPEADHCESCSKMISVYDEQQSRLKKQDKTGPRVFLLMQIVEAMYKVLCIHRMETVTIDKLMQELKEL